MLRRTGFLIRRWFTSETSTVISLVDTHLTTLSDPSSKLSSHALKQLQILKKNSVRILIPELTKDNELGYLPHSGTVSRGTLVDFVVEQKRLHPDKIILVRVGEFYETYGVDALLMIEFAGLNPMGNKARAGCPIKNIQQTLDQLTNAGLMVAVYEEINVGVNQFELKKGKIKHRVLSQIISQASPTYTYALRLSDSLDFRESRPAVGITFEVSGYSLCQIYVDERSMLIRDKLPLEALQTIISTSGCLEPLYISRSLKGTLSTELGVSEEILDTADSATGGSRWSFHQQVLQRVGRSVGVDIADFREINHTSKSLEVNKGILQPQPLYLSTAKEIGVLSNPNVPSLVPCLLPPSCTSSSAKFLQKLLVSPPPHHISQHFRSILQILSGPDHFTLPKMTTVGIGKIVSLLSASRCNAASFREIAQNMSGVLTLLSPSSALGNLLSIDLLQLVAFESGVSTIVPSDFISRLSGLISIISQAITSQVNSSAASASDDRPQTIIPEEFFRRNENEFRGIFVTGYDKEFDDLLRSTLLAMDELIEAVAADLEELSNISQPTKRKPIEVVYDPINNLIAFRAVSKTITAKQFKDKDFFHPLDRNFQSISNRFTSARTTSALSEYLTLCNSAEKKADDLMRQLCRVLYKELLVIVQSAHCATIFQCAYEHAVSSLQRGWVLPSMAPLTETPRVFRVKGLFPFWMSHLASVTNDLDIADTILLTAPNMAGKSTLMRSVLVTALLANCGLFVPCTTEATVPEYDAYFLRTSSFDIPSEGKSSFAVEMSDLRAIMRDTSRHSFLMMDEIGRGTSTSDGAALSGAILEWMSDKSCHGIFATHLLELLHLPLQVSLHKMKMGIRLNPEGRPVWTYKIEEGWIEDSMAFETATQFGVSSVLIQRALELKTSLSYLRSLPSSTSLSSVSAVAVTTTAVSSEDRHSETITSLRSFLSDLLQRTPALQPHLRSQTHSITFVPFGCVPPPFLERSCCVYLLLLRTAASANDSNGRSNSSRADSSRPPAIYVGETESAMARLESHRSNRSLLKYMNTTQKTSRLEFDALLIPIANKSAARALESLLISALKAQNYEVCGDKDACHTRFSLDPSS